MKRDVSHNVWTSFSHHTGTVTGWCDAIMLRRVNRRAPLGSWRRYFLNIAVITVVVCFFISVGVSECAFAEPEEEMKDADVVASPLFYDAAENVSAGNELALQYTFGGANLVLVLSENGVLHAYNLESGSLAWSTDVGGDMIAVEVDMPPSRETILRDPLAIPFLVRGNSLFTRTPFYTYNPSPSSSFDTAELLSHLPDTLRPYFFMNISTLLRRQSVFFGGTDIFVTSSVEVADLDSSTGHHIHRYRHRGGRRGTSQQKNTSPRRPSASDAASPRHNELTPVLHVVRYNIVLHVMKANEYSWSITLSQLQLSPRGPSRLVAELQQRRATEATRSLSEEEDVARDGVESKEHNTEGNPRFFSHVMRDLFDYDATHAAEQHHRDNRRYTEVRQGRAHSEGDGDASSGSVGGDTVVSVNASASTIIAALQRRRTQLAQYVSSVLSLQHLNISHVQLRNMMENSATWTAALPSTSPSSSSFVTSDKEEDEDEDVFNSAPPQPSSLASSQAIAAYLWVSGADDIFRIPVQSLANADAFAQGDHDEGPGVYVEGPGDVTADATPRLRLTPSTFSGAVVPMHGSSDGLQLIPFSHQAVSLYNDRLSHAVMAMDVEGDEREGAELDRYYHERSWWESQMAAAAAAASGSASPAADNPFASFSSAGEVVRTGLAWRTAGIISFHVLCLAGSIAFLCAGVPPRNQLQRAWAQADRNRDRLSHTAVSVPPSAQLMPQDLMAGSASPFSPTIDGFSVDSPGLHCVGCGAAAAASSSLTGRSLSPARLDAYEAPEFGMDSGDASPLPVPHKWDDRTPEEVYAMMREESEEKLTPLMTASNTSASARGGVLTSSQTTATQPSGQGFAMTQNSTAEAAEACGAHRKSDASAASSASDKDGDEDSEDIDMGERWWVRAQHRPRLPSVATLDETVSEKGSSVSFSPVHGNSEEEGKLFQLHFKVLEKVGFGGEGSVFCVEHRVTHARYAIKAIMIHEQDEERVVQEAVLHSSFDNANVVRFYFCWIEDIAVSTADRLQLCTFGGDGMDTMSLGLSARSMPVSSPTDGTLTEEEADDSAAGDTYHMLFIQMEYFPRGTLADWLRSRKGFYRLDVLRYMQNIADGLAYLHNQDVVHRDLKPTNIFVSNANVLKIGDFGLAKRRVATTNSNGDLTSNVAGAQQERSVVGGSPLYCSPEQTRGDPVNKPSDIFSFGIIAVEMLCTFETLHERIRILTDAHQGVLPAELEKDFPEETQIIKPLLASEPQHRPSLRKVQRQLMRLIDTLEESDQDGEEVPHSPAETVEPTQLPPRRDGRLAAQTTLVPASNHTSTHTDVETVGIFQDNVSPLLRTSTTAAFFAAAQPSAENSTHTRAAAAASGDSSAMEDPLHLSPSGKQQQDLAGNADPLPAWQAAADAAAAAAAAPSSIASATAAPSCSVPRQGSATSAQSLGASRHRNSYHDRRYASSSSSPGAEAATAHSSSLETPSPGGRSSTTPAELIVTDPYGLPTTPVTYTGDADLSTILKRDLQDRTISPPD